MPERTIRLVRDGFPDRMSLDTAVSRTLLNEADRGERQETLRLTVPGRSLAFGKHDVATSGFDDAVHAARDEGFEPFVRLAGGRAAAFHEQTVAISWVVPEEKPIDGIRRRFTTVSNILAESFLALGADAVVGAIPGEYCPGEFSIHVGATKVAGIGQRLARGAAHIGGVIVVDGGDEVRRALVPVYEALGLDWDPGTAGALADSVAGIKPEGVIDAIVARLQREVEIQEAPLSAHTVTEAEELIGSFTPA